MCLAVAVTILTGCARTDAASDSTKVAQSGAAVPISRATFDPATHTAVIYAKDFAFESPDSVTAGWTTVKLVNDGTTLHHVQLVRLDSSKTAADLKDALAKPGALPRWVVFVGGPNSPDPKGQSSAIVNLAAGQYMLICMIDIGDHVPHFAKGMVHPLTVVADAGPATVEPKSDATIALVDYGFTVTGALNAGEHTIKVTNTGPQAHELVLARLAPGKTSKDLEAWIDKPMGPPPASAVGGMVAIEPGISSYFTTTLTAGNYTLLCFVPDSKDGKPHVAHGMVKDITVS
jgi:uncharacterized cupredoxin-like copper-binding protein